MTKRKKPSVMVMKVAIDNDLKARLKIECAKLGKPQQYVIGRLIAVWVEAQERKR